MKVIGVKSMVFGDVQMNNDIPDASLNATLVSLR